MSDELTWMSAGELRALVAAREASPVEILEAHLGRIDEAEPLLHSFITVCADRAMTHARRAERAVARGEPLGALHGLPVALKDEVWTQGVPSTGGSLVFARFVPRRHGIVAERLEAAGAVIVGKTNLPELASWPRSKNRLVPESVNPWDPARISGASSGGSAACVAAGLVPLAVGSDGGGSIRIPAALCGIVGLYPTAGRVPSYGSFSYSTAGSLGPMARTVADVALLQGVLGGPDPRDPWALAEAPFDLLGTLEAGVQGLRVAWSPDFGHLAVAGAVARAVEGAVAVLASLGADVEPLDRLLEHPWGDGRAMAGIQEAVAGREWPEPGADPSQLPDIGPEEHWMWSAFAEGAPLTTTPRFRALCARHRSLLAPHSQLTVDAAVRGPDPEDERRHERLVRTMASVFERFDVVCSPTMPVVAPRAPAGWATPYADPFMGTNFTFLANATGCSAASVPCGLADGLPVGLQVIGRPRDEATVLRVCRAFEAARPGPLRPPSPPGPATEHAGSQAHARPRARRRGAA